MSEKMIFCLGDGKYESKGEGYQKHLRIFNKDVSLDEYNRVNKLLSDNEIKISLTKWIDEEDLKESEKTNTTRQIGGKLKVFSYEDAWSNFWKEATQEQKDAILTLPQFDADIFKGITGIDVSKENTKKQELLKKADELLEKAEELKKQASEI